MMIVVGSGPAGVSCAQALLAQGADVLLIDAGQSLEPAATVQIEALAQTAPESWTTGATAFLKERIETGTSGIRLKMAYGSDFPYRESPGATQVDCDEVDIKASYARGGFSNVWGSAVLPYRDEDISEWPIRAQALEDAYRAVLTWMPFSACHDDLEQLFPLFSNGDSNLPLSRQATALLADLNRNKQNLNHSGLFFGASRLAVNSTNDVDSQGCVSCGLCMYGCPHRLIYSSDLTIEVLKANPNFQYRPGLTVRTVSESGPTVSLQGVDSTGDTFQLTAERVFLAAGVLETTSILLRSLQRYESPVTLKDSQYFLLPVLRWKGTTDVATERLHTLAQLFLEIVDPSLSPYTVHLQTYTYNELFRERIVAAAGPAKALIPIEPFVGRLLLFQGYLHSAHSPSISATLHSSNGNDVLKLAAVPNPEAHTTMRKLIKKLMGMARWTGLVPLFPLLQPGQPGRGFHAGGSFPMSNKPGPAETDLFGRPMGMQRVHAVDATIFPTIPATTITFTVMANAFRIGSLLEQYASGN